MTPNDPTAAQRARCADGTALAAALRDARAHTLATFAAYEEALRDAAMAVPYSPEVNPPLWELGHVGWFQDWWLCRNPQHTRGSAADPDVPRVAPRRAGADAWFDSSRVPHGDRWHLPLPGAEALRDDLASGLHDSLELLRTSAPDDDALYFFRLVLFHEDMHHEAAVYMAQHLRVPLAGWSPRADAPAQQQRIAACTHAMGSAAPSFAFDNELGSHAAALADFTIDSAPVTWARYVAFIEAGGYQRRECWSDDGWAWRQVRALEHPRYLRERGGTWHRDVFGEWIELDPALPAMNLTAHEADAYCRWAGRRLPSEAQWECAAVQLGTGFQWGQVWEWTASAFAPYPGFSPHPYRDYSQPWFHSRRVLRGASFATHSRMQHPRYRNFFPPDRNDIFAGFRTCALRG